MAADRCPCGGKLEASAKVYFDCEVEDGQLRDLTFSGLNDELDGHPCAIEAELRVMCEECGREVEYEVPDDAPWMQRAKFNGLGV